MAGTKAGAQKARDKNLAKNPNYYSEIGTIGGKMSTPGGFGTEKRGKDGMTGRERARHINKLRKASRENNSTST